MRTEPDVGHEADPERFPCENETAETLAEESEAGPGAVLDEVAFLEHDKRERRRVELDPEPGLFFFSRSVLNHGVG